MVHCYVNSSFSPVSTQQKKVFEKYYSKKNLHLLRPVPMRRPEKPPTVLSCLQRKAPKTTDNTFQSWVLSSLFLFYLFIPDNSKETAHETCISQDCLVDSRHPALGRIWEESRPGSYSIHAKIKVTDLILGTPFQGLKPFNVG